jgi:hypothetical protein
VVDEGVEAAVLGHGVEQLRSRGRWAGPHDSQLELGLFTSTQGIECGWELAGQTVVFNGFNDPSMLVGSKVRLTVNFSSPDDALSAHADVVLR